MHRYQKVGTALLVSLLLAGCGGDGDPGYDAPQGSEPFDSIAPPPDQEMVPGASQPGPQDERGGS